MRQSEVARQVPPGVHGARHSRRVGAAFIIDTSELAVLLLVVFPILNIVLGIATDAERRERLHQRVVARMQHLRRDDRDGL